MTRARTPHAVVQRFIRFANDHGLAGQSVAIAFSAGPDSTALAICAAEAARAIDLKPTLLHIDHNSRPGTASDATRAAALAEHLALPFKAAMLPAADRPSEEELRAGRYIALADLMSIAGIPTLLTAHHANDQAETLLLHLIRGAGPDGATAIRIRQSFQITGMPDSIDLIRPFLTESRDALHTLVADRGVIPVDDPTNLSHTYRRNAVRHRVLPVLEEIDPGAARHLAAFTDLIAEDNALLNDLAQSFLAEALIEKELSIPEFRHLPDAITSRMIRSWVLEQTGLVLTRDRTVAVLNLSKVGQGGAIIEIGEGWAVQRSGQTLKIRSAIDHAHGGTSES